MLKYLALLFAALFVSASFAGPVQNRRSVRADGGISFSSDNVTLSNANTYQYHQSTLIDFGAGLFYLSVSVDAEGDETEGSASASGVFGLVLVIPSTHPTIWASFVESNMEYSANNIPSATNVNFEASASLALSVYDKLEEVDAEGNVVKTINLNTVTFSAGKITKVAGGGVDDALTYTTYEAKTTDGEITLTVVTSNIIGRLNVGAVVTPQCLEVIFEVSDYVYQDETNHLRLTIIGATGSSSAKIHATGTLLVSGNDVNAPYVLLGGDVLVGENADETSVEVVIVGEWQDVDKSDLPLVARTAIVGMEAQKTEFAIKMATVDFPAGAKFISYDPQIGFNVPGSAAALIPGLAILLSVIAAFLKF